MKKALSLILALVVCLTLCACDKSNQSEGQLTEPTNQDNNNTVHIGGNLDLNDQPLIMSIADGDGTINVEKLRKAVEVVELTTENWKEHFKVYSYSYTEEKVEKDAFGEVVSTETITHDGYALGAGNERYHGYINLVIELKDKTTGELFIYETDGDDISVEADFNLDNYECTRIKGSICYLNIPIGEIPVEIWFYPVFPGDEMPQPGALKIEPGTHSFGTYFVIEWCS